MGTQHQYQPLVQGQLAVRKVCWLQCSYHITSYYHKFNLPCLIFGLNILRPYYFSQVYSSLLQMNFATVLFVYKVTMVCYVCNHSMTTLCIPNLYFSYLMRFCGQFCCNIFFWFDSLQTCKHETGSLAYIGYFHAWNTRYVGLSSLFH